MRQDPITLSKIWQTASYGFMAIGLFLLFFLGAQAFAKITDASQVVGKPRQKPSPADYTLHTVLPFVDSSNASVAVPVVDFSAQPGSRGSDTKQPSRDSKGHAASRTEVTTDKQAKEQPSLSENKNSGR